MEAVLSDSYCYKPTCLRYKRSVEAKRGMLVIRKITTLSIHVFCEKVEKCLLVCVRNFFYFSEKNPGCVTIDPQIVACDDQFFFTKLKKNSCSN